MKRSLIHIVLVIFFLCFVSPVIARQVSKQAQPSRQEIQSVSIQNIKGNIYQVKGGSGANTGFFIGKKEVVVVDSKMTEDAAKQMIWAIRKMTSNPIVHIIITHSDRDHVNGLVGFPQGLTIISHENTRIHMDKAFQSARERTYLPDITFSDKLSLYCTDDIKNKRIDLIYFGPAHTDGDIIVYFPDEKVAFIGDLIFIDRDQLIHLHKNGSSYGLVKVLKSILNLDAEVFINGHGDPASRKDIQNHIQGIEDKQARIKELMKEGKNLDVIKKIYNIDNKPAQPGAMVWPSMVETIYLELSKQR
ncbi:MAG: MBL fold metallo-hydrolase [Proteobacteria bacterium]|nr:MBL fold metallo-hydrolase [Pseudomonadota bacterium]